MTASVSTSEYEVLIQKLMATVNLAIDKATGPEAQSLLQSYMTYVVFQNILNIVILVFIMVVCIVSTKMCLSNRAKWLEKGERDRYGELRDPGAAVLVPGIVAGILLHFFAFLEPRPCQNGWRSSMIRDSISCSKFWIVLSKS